MNRTSQENIKTNTIFVIGDIQRVKLDKSAKLPRIIIKQTIQFKNIKQDSLSNPLNVFTQGNSIIVIDDNQQAWLASQSFDGPINLSNLIRNKISKVYLGEKELIAQTKKGNILINWGAKKLLEKNNLSKLNTFGSNDYDSLFEVYLIDNSFSSDFYFYSPEKKIDNLNRLYFINKMENQIIGYPTGLMMNFNKNVKGLSVGKHYTLCWDDQGKLYSWGSKSLGLGYGYMPDEQFIQTPQSVKITKKVISAYADIHYSLALTDEGAIYQWGIKRDINEINQEPIFKPKQLQFKYFRCKAKFLALKGKESNYGVLSSQGQLYVWGATARNLLSPNIILPSTWKKTYIYEPVLQTDFLDYQVHDFSIENGYLTVVAGNSTEIIGNEQYWNGIIKKAKIQLSNFKMTRVNTEAEQVSKLKKKYKNSILDFNDAKTERGNNSNQKGDYLRLTTLDVPRLTKNISQQNLHSNLDIFKKAAPPTINNFYSASKLHKRQASQIPSNLIENKQSNKLRLSEVNILQKFGNIFRKGSKISQIYSQKWHEVLQKKKLQSKAATKQSKIIQLDQQTDEKDSIDSENTFTYQQIQQILSQTLKKKLVKNYIGYFIKTVIGQVRKKQQQSKCNSEININFIEEEFSCIQWVISNMQKLKCKYFIRYTILMMYFKKYVRNFRKRTFERSRITVTASIIKKSLKQKMIHQLESFHYKTSKISKLNQWLIFYHNEQRKCMKQLWNNFVIFSFKLKDGGQFNFTHPNPDLTYKQLFNSKIQDLPCLHLQNYFRMKNPQSSTNNLRLRRTINNAEFKRRAHKKLKTQKITLTLQVLPYSIHYNYFRKPKNLDVNLGQVNRNNTVLVQLQKKTLQQFINQTLWQHSRDYYIKKKEYDVQMGQFIAAYYETFYQKRWKFIIEYNKIQKSALKKKKESELKRLLKLVGMVKLYQDDCIPQKYIVLEQATKRKGSPIQPDPIYQFELQTFQKIYKSYVQLLQSKIRALKKKIK